LIDLAAQHAIAYAHHRVVDRLEKIELNPSSYKRLCEGLHRKTVRESAIPEGDIEASIRFFISHPDVGAGKARVSLIDKEEAYLSTATINAVKQELSCEVEQEYKRRKDEEKLRRGSTSTRPPSQSKEERLSTPQSRVSQSHLGHRLHEYQVLGDLLRAVCHLR